jgi:hypothetical protein
MGSQPNGKLLELMPAIVGAGLTVWLWDEMLNKQAEKVKKVV